ncbi:MAG: FemAB family XrtA/PEP-CTERM system-associated protein [Thermodesulfobacteriota bacterium]
MNVRLAAADDKKVWDAYVQGRPEASPYSLFAWKEAVELAYGFRGRYLLAEEEGRVKGVLPLFLFRVPFRGCSLVSLPYCDLGGLLADTAEARNALLTECLTTAKDEKAKTIVIRTAADDLFAGAGNGADFAVETGKVRMLLDLPGSSEMLWQGFKSKLRSQVRKAEKNGLVFKWVGPEKINEFYDVFSRNMHALGSPVHSKKWLESVLAHFGQAGRMGMVYKDEQPAGCGIIIASNQLVSIPWASTLREFNRLSPNMLLYWSFLKFAADNNKKVFDFGRSTPNEGTYRFKKQWGAEPVQLYWYRSGKDAGHNDDGPSSALSRERLESMWQQLPLSVANLMGPMIRKYISL